MRWLRTIALPGAALCLTACGGTAATPTADASGGEQSQSSCTIYDSGFDARLTITSGSPQGECSLLAKDFSSGGSFWTSQSQAPSEPPLGMVCIMQDGGNTAEVADDGGQIVGQQVCSDLLSSGWTEDSQAEQQASQEAAGQASAAASASQAANAAAAQQQQTGQDRQNAKSDLSTLQQDSSLASSSTLDGDLASFASDVQTANSDLGTEKQDATASNSYCSTTDTVAGDAESVDGDLQSVGGDVESLSPDLSTVRQDISTLKGDLQRVSADGLPALAGASAAIVTARTNLRQAITQANGYITQVNAIDAEAYSIADNLATGSCSGDGPGSPTSPIPAILVYRICQRTDDPQSWICGRRRHRDGLHHCSRRPIPTWSWCN
jgi:hypothetical protein